MLAQSLSFSSRDSTRPYWLGRKIPTSDRESETNRGETRESETRRMHRLHTRSQPVLVCLGKCVQPAWNSLLTIKISEMIKNSRYLLTYLMITFFRFPSNPALRKKWMPTINRPDWIPRKNSTICSKHFEAKRFIQRKHRRVLMKDSIPTLFVPVSMIFRTRFI